MGACSPPVALANPAENATRIQSLYEQLSAKGCSVVLTPELSLTGYSCEDLFYGSELLEESERCLFELARQTKRVALVVGAPLRITDGRLLNCAFVCVQGNIQGAVPKSELPNTGEFHDRRWFAPGAEVSTNLPAPQGSFPVGRNLLFEIGPARFGIEICEDLWAPISPGVEHAVAGANVLLNLSASNEIVGKSDYRRDLVRMQSGKCIAGYLYAGASIWESTKDVVYGGHSIAAENGVVLGESAVLERLPESLIAEFDVAKLEHQRGLNSNFLSAPRNNKHRTVPLGTGSPLPSLRRKIQAHPFVPDSETDLDARASVVLRIQTMGLLRRFCATGCRRLVVGISGGLDSALALLACHEVMSELGSDAVEILPIWMPGPGTSSQTSTRVDALVRALGLELRTIPISRAVERHLADIGHEGALDLTFENAQARERTQVLFDVANQENGLVVGSSDMSELALGWCTYSGDHMSAYAVNAGIPKTLVAAMVRWYAYRRADARLQAQLEDVLKAPMSPELLPGADGSISQRTEDILGPFELHDFFLHELLRCGSSVRRIYHLARQAFENRYSGQFIRECLKTFVSRFHSQQFKRTTLPAGPKVGTVSLSPRGDWRMPDETDPNKLLETIDELDD